MAKFTFVLLLFCEAAVKLTGNPEVKGSHPVRAAVGEDVILPCHLEPPLNVTNLTVDWKFSGTVIHLYRDRADDPGSQHEAFKNRTSLFHDEMTKGNISLKLFSVKKDDEGNYTCNVPKLKSPVKKGYITLIIEDRTKQSRADSSRDLSLGLGLGFGLGLVIVIVVIVTVVLVKKKKKKKKHEAGNRTTEGNEGEGEGEEHELSQLNTTNNDA